MSGSSLSDSCYSVSSEAAQGGSVPPARPLKLWEQVPLSADNTDVLWSESSAPQQQPASQSSLEDTEPAEVTPASGELVHQIDPCHVHPFIFRIRICSGQLKQFLKCQLKTIQGSALAINIGRALMPGNR